MGTGTGTGMVPGDRAPKRVPWKLSASPRLRRAPLAARPPHSPAGGGKWARRGHASNREENPFKTELPSSLARWGSRVFTPQPSPFGGCGSWSPQPSDTSIMCVLVLNLFFPNLASRGGGVFVGYHHFQLKLIYLFVSLLVLFQVQVAGQT